MTDPIYCQNLLPQIFVLIGLCFLAFIGMLFYWSINQKYWRFIVKRGLAQEYEEWKHDRRVD